VDESWIRWALGVPEMTFTEIMRMQIQFLETSAGVNRSRMESDFPDFTEGELIHYNRGYFAAFDEVKEALGLNQYIKLIKKLDPDA
jgi:phage terminase large subunit-like protein